MSINCHNLCDDWGWYVDIETVIPICQVQADKVKVLNKKNTMKIIKLETIEEEDEYDYYTFNQKNSCEFDVENNKIDKPINKKNNNALIINILNISSTTMLTALLTYVIFFML